MEYKLLRKTVTNSIYNVDNAFYLIVPKMIVDRNIEVVIEEEVNSKFNEIFNSSMITIVRPFAKGYFDNIDDLVVRQKLRVLINNDIDLARQALDQEGIKYNDVSSLKTPFEEFKEWYLGETDKQKKLNMIDTNIAKPSELYKETSDELVEIEKRKEELLSLKQELIENKDSIDQSSKGSEKGHQKLLANGKSTLKSFDDGFINIILLSLVTLVVTVGTMLAMIYIMR